MAPQEGCGHPWKNMSPSKPVPFAGEEDQAIYSVIRNSVAPRLKDRIRKEFTKPLLSHNGLDILELEMKEVRKDVENQVQLLSLGNRSGNEPDMVILILGATGSGKTTLINAIVNYIFGVDFEDPFRFVVTDNEDATKRSQADSQTDYITAYSFGYYAGMPRQYNYIIVDTPGLGDSRGIHRDEQMVRQLKTFLEEDYDVKQVSAIGNVVPASATRLTATQKYIFDSMSSIFGKDTKEHMYVLNTFADGGPPSIVEALKEANVCYQEILKFNNSALYASNSQGSTPSNYIHKHNWKMGMDSMNNFFQKLSLVSPTSLQMTKEVLQKRIELKECIVTIRNIVEIGLIKLSNLKQEQKMLSLSKNKGENNNYGEVFLEFIPKLDGEGQGHENDGEGKGHENVFTFVYNTFMKFLKKTIEFFARLFNINIPTKENEKYSASYAYVTKPKTVKEVLEYYKQKNYEKVSIDISNMIESLGEHILILVKGVEILNQQLEDIALEPHPHSTPDYIDLMIESEKINLQFGWEVRVKMLECLKKDAHIQQRAQYESLSLMKPEAIIKYLWSYIKD